MTDWRVGMKVVCIRDFLDCAQGETSPQVGSIYTIREISLVQPTVPEWAGHVRFRLVEIINEPRRYLEGVSECWFIHTSFRPLVDNEDKLDISVFQKLLDEIKTPVDAGIVAE